MGKDKLCVVFVAGAGRSGSTIIERILDSMDNYVSIGEFRFFTESIINDETCACGQPIKRCRFWNAVLEEVFGSVNNFDVREFRGLWTSVARMVHFPLLCMPFLRTKQYQNKLDRYISLMERFYHGIAHVSGSRIIVDTSKAPPHGCVLGELSSVNLKVLHLVRHSAAVAFSWQNKKKITGQRYMNTFPVWHSSASWLLFNVMAEMLRFQADDYVLVKYEDFAVNPKLVLMDALHNLKMPAIDIDCFIDEKTVALGTYHSVSGNPVRFHKDSQTIRVDRRWETSMSRKDKFLAELLTLPGLVRYGYFAPLKRKS